MTNSVEGVSLILNSATWPEQRDIITAWKATKTLMTQMFGGTTDPNHDWNILICHQLELN